ncbi:LytR family transcriptional regulator [Candidatus Parcubacteria bacterium]|nr:LytR family transcriptional regulator [Candidatus Parcubacteria bacterium]
MASVRLTGTRQPRLPTFQKSQKAGEYAADFSPLERHLRTSEVGHKIASVMEKPQIDFLKQKYELHHDRKNNLLFFGRALVGVLVVGAVIGSVFSYRVTTTANSHGYFPKLSIISTIRQFVDGNDLEGEQNDRVNLLLMGIGGEGHEGPQLTDTMIFASYQPSSGKIGLMSIPRDLSVPIPGYGYRKVNHANAFGEMEKTGYGPRLAGEVVSATFGQPIQYYVRVDFKGFAELIDDLGGIDVFVDRGFTDPKYPALGMESAQCGNAVPASPTVGDDEISHEESASSSPQGETPRTTQSPDYSCRFEALTFQEGWTHLDGDLALKFVRSRHGTNGEGSDFARSARQQKVLLAVKDKVFSASTFLNPARVKRILETLEKNIATNLDVSEIITLARAVKDVKEGQMTHQVLDASETSPLYATVLNGAFVLLPKNDDWVPLQRMAEYIYEQNPTAARFADAPAGGKPKFVKVEIQNGTNVTGLALRASQLLDGQGFDVVRVGNAATRGYQHTVIYDLSNGARAIELKALRDFLQADVTLSATGWMVSGEVVPKGITVGKEELLGLATEPDVDFLVILGDNASALVRN